MFVSDSNFNVTKYRCLTISKIESIAKKEWEKKVTYHCFQDEKRTWFSWFSVGIKKTAHSYVFENELTPSTTTGQRKQDLDSRVLYTDYNTCILMETKALDN
ncbi:hypothetical protein V5799_032233 [Amblyomma americanum]|uniref:Uncharacterized protein n=1 Tax=Amblyomma americanum TaxID=6943 RepID=A0AAQ4DRS8_AMBAM